MATREYIPIRPVPGGHIHATSMGTPGRTACGKKCDGWVIEPKRLSCPDCRDAVRLPARARSRQEIR